LDKTMNHDFEARVSDVKSRAHGHWTGILRSLGVDEDILKGKNLPCPIDGCGGTEGGQEVMVDPVAQSGIADLIHAAELVERNRAAVR
jgi:hypothetical protein